MLKFKNFEISAKNGLARLPKKELIRQKKIKSELVVLDCNKEKDNPRFY